MNKNLNEIEFKKQLFTTWTSILFKQGLIDEEKKRNLLKEIIRI